MTIRFKAAGASLLAVLAVGAFLVLNASATTGGHFTFDAASSPVTLHGSDEPADRVQLTGAATVECHTATYQGETDEATETSVTLTPTYDECTSSFGAASIDMNECDYLLTVKSPANTGHNTVHLACPAGSAGPVITTPNCTFTVTPNQTPTGGVTYTNVSGDITADITVEGLHITYSPAGSIGCAFQSTTAKGQLHGSVTMEGILPVEITAT